MMQTQVLISAPAFRKRLSDPDWVAVDCRADLLNIDAGRMAYDQKHIAGAVFLDLDRDLAGPVRPDTGRHPLPDVGDISARLGELGIRNTDKVVVYDDNIGAIAARAWWILRWLGHDTVYLLDGGMAHWERMDLPIDGAKVRRAPTTYAARPDSSMVITTDELASDVPDIADRNLLDARDRTRFRGEQEPIDPVPGHVPGAVNVPFTDFVNKDGTWRSLDERAGLMEGVLGCDREASWCVMCGSGVTACHLAISGLEAGFSEPRLYAGSWSEWIRDSGRPIGSGEG